MNGCGILTHKGGFPYLVTGTRGLLHFAMNGSIEMVVQGFTYLVTNIQGVAYFVTNVCIEFLIHGVPYLVKK